MADGNPNKENFTTYVLIPLYIYIETVPELEWNFLGNNTWLVCTGKVNDLKVNHQLFLM